MKPDYIDISKNNITNPNSTFIKVGIKIKKLATYHIHAYIDTGASMCLADKYIFPEELWKTINKIIRVKIANDTIVTLDKVIENQEIDISGEKFNIPTIYK